MREAYTTALSETAKHGMRLRERRTESDMAEIFEAWVTAGLAGMVDILGWDATRDLLRHKLGELPVPQGTKPVLIVNNTTAA